MNKKSTLIRSLMEQLENEREEKEACQRELAEIEQAALKSLKLQEDLFMTKLSQIENGSGNNLLLMQIEDLNEQVVGLKKQLERLTMQLKSLMPS